MTACLRKISCSVKADKMNRSPFLCFMGSTNEQNFFFYLSVFFFCLCWAICVSSSGFTAWLLALSVDADSSQQTCWHAPEWAPRFWGFSPVLLSGCWRCRPWFFSIWPYGSETRSSPAPRSVSVRARSGSAQSGKGTFYSETPSPVPAAARW